MHVQSIAGFAVISDNPAASRRLYEGLLQLPLKQQDDYRYMDRFPGANHFGVWPLRMAAQSCFGSESWPTDLPVPQVTLEFELESIAAVEAAVVEMKAAGQAFVHEARTEPWRQTLARFMSPEYVLVGLSYAPWLHR